MSLQVTLTPAVTFQGPVPFRNSATTSGSTSPKEGQGGSTQMCTSGIPAGLSVCADTLLHTS
jgi:hypothetical protein